ncbi:MAG: tRNA lysidine(34) synthetase TilS [Rhizomicrobium sp.]
MAELGAAWPAAVAVSGGGDSIALMLLLAGWAKAPNRQAPVVLTVDHGLRKTAAADARRVVRWAQAAGLAAHILKWEGTKPKADIEAKARQARYRLMGDWCCANGIAALHVAHTQEDQAETFLLRLGRGSGLDGLSAMQARSRLPLAGGQDVAVLRPLLEFSRDELRAYLLSREQRWLEDPMNADPRFARTRVRALLPALAEAGISTARIAAATGHLARVRQLLETETAAFLSAHSCLAESGVQFDGAALCRLPEELGLRALARMLANVSGEAYRPRFERLERLYGAIVTGSLSGGATLQGCRIAPAPRRQAAFGPASLIIAPESGRKGTRHRPGS